MKSQTLIANVEQAEAWDGHEGEQWAANADRYDRTGRTIWQRFKELVAIDATDIVLDVGCGTGRATRDIAKIAADGSALGIDLSGPMLQVARDRSKAESLSNVSFVQGDAQVFEFEADSFDLAVSSFGAMFFGDATAAYTNIGRALKPGGRLAVLTWREIERNEWLMGLRSSLAMGRDLPVPSSEQPGPFSLAIPDRASEMLGAAGFANVKFDAVEEPMDLGADVSEALAFVKTMGIFEGLTNGLDSDQKTKAVEQVQNLLEAHATPDGVLFGSSAWLITARLGA